MCLVLKLPWRACPAEQTETSQRVQQAGVLQVAVIRDVRDMSHATRETTSSEYSPQLCRDFLQNLQLGCSDASKVFKHQPLMKYSNPLWSPLGGARGERPPHDLCSWWPGQRGDPNTAEARSRQGHPRSIGGVHLWAPWSSKHFARGGEGQPPSPRLKGGLEGRGGSRQPACALAPGRKVLDCRVRPPTFQPHESPIIHAWCQQGRAPLPAAAGSLPQGAWLPQHAPAHGSWAQPWPTLLPLPARAGRGFWNIVTWPGQGQNNRRKLLPSPQQQT